MGRGWRVKNQKRDQEKKKGSKRRQTAAKVGKQSISNCEENKMEINEDIVIVGAGIAGLSTALGLHRLGVRSLVLESSDSLRVSGFGFVVSTNAWRALDALGIGDYLRHQHLQITELQGISLATGLPMFKTPLDQKGKYEYNECRCVKRRLLLETLAKLLPQGSIRYSSKVVFIEESGPSKVVHLADGSVVKAKVLIGCDGVHSAVAKWLGFGQPTTILRATIRGVVDFPDGHGLEPLFTQHFGDCYRYGHLPCDEKSIYWFLTFKLDHEDVYKDLKNNPASLKQFVLNKLVDKKISPKSKAIIEKTELNNVAIASLTIRWPWEIVFGNISKGNVCIVGDALHPMTPDLGQGGCSALEEAVVLARCLAGAIENGKVGIEEEDERKKIEKGLETYAKERRWRDTSLVSAACFFGYLREANGVAMVYLRKFLSGFMKKWQLNLLDYDCGKLVHA